MAKKFDKVYLEMLYKRVDVEQFLDKYHAHVTSGEVVTHRGREIRMHCIMPGHRDNSASASFNVDNGLYNCWSKCGGFTFWKLVQELENLPRFPDAVEFVKKLVGFEDDGEIDELRLTREKLNRFQTSPDDLDNSLVPKFVNIDLDNIKEFEDALDHMDVVKSRVDEDMVKTWGLKYATSGHYQGRLIIPFRSNNSVVSFAARDMLGRAERWNKINKRAREKHLTRTELEDLRKRFEVKKIVYPPTASSSSHSILGSPTQFILFNLDHVLQQGKDDYVILTEGPFDAMKLWSWGFNAVALLGLKLSAYKRMLILQNFSRVYICLDNDDKDDGSNPGQDAAAEIVKSLIDNVYVHNIMLPKGKDPDDCEISEFEDCLKQSQEF